MKPTLRIAHSQDGVIAEVPATLLHLYIYISQQGPQKAHKQH